MTPTYTSMLQEIGRQLKLRKKSIFGRTLLISWPVLLLIIAGYVIKILNPEAKPEELILQSRYWIPGSIYLVCAIIYGTVIGFIFEIEKRIWIDSYFDQKNLTPKESWTIAKKLFWPAFKLRLSIFFRYYLLAIIVPIAIVIADVYFAIRIGGGEQGAFIAIMAVIPLVLIGMGVYVYFLNIKLRYSWFIFLDKYNGGEFTNAVVFDELDTLNQVAKGEAFKKALVVELGTSSVRVITDMAVKAISIGAEMIGSVLGDVGGQMLGNLTRAYGQELARQVTSYANISAMYIMYRFARKTAFGTEQVENNYVYDLK